MSKVCVLITSYLEPEHVSRIAATSPELEVIYEPALLPTPRYRADHHGASFCRTPSEERRWQQNLARAEILFDFAFTGGDFSNVDFDFANFDRLLELAPNVRWIQATSAGVGELLIRPPYAGRSVVITTASGIHATPLAEFCLWAMIGFAKDAPRLVREQVAHHWERYCSREVHGTTVGIVGVGKVGREVARLCHAFGAHVIGTARTPRIGPDPEVDEWVSIEDLSRLLSVSDTVIACTPQTPRTKGLIGEREIRSMKRGALFINVGRGPVVDELALIAALRDGHLGGAALDVFAREPLPPDSPLWDMPNVIVSPHSASTAETENARLADLFCRNLTRYLRREPLLNVFDWDRLY